MIIKFVYLLENPQGLSMMVIDRKFEVFVSYIDEWTAIFVIYYEQLFWNELSVSWSPYTCANAEL